MRGEVATIAVHEYAPLKDKQKVPWPVLHCHPHARGPFIAFDEKEKQRWERQQQKKLEEQANPAVEQKVATRPRRNTFARPRIPLANGASHGDLRRSVSLNNLRRKGHSPPEALEQDVEGDVFDSANASGFLVSGAAYMAASGNSVGITSTTGTTSTAGGFRKGQLPLAMDLAIKRQILTSKKATGTSRPEGRRLGTMDPPTTLPTKNEFGNLKKAKSMSFKPPKREEGMKPGYCESCRQKFDDFKTVSTYGIWHIHDC
jgi:regulatory subunit for Cdc7p protein kinase